jgi:hypothetical protein
LIRESGFSSCAFDHYVIALLSLTPSWWRFISVSRARASHVDERCNVGIGQKTSSNGQQQSARRATYRDPHEWLSGHDGGGSPTERVRCDHRIVSCSRWCPPPCGREPRSIMRQHDCGSHHNGVTPRGAGQLCREEQVSCIDVIDFEMRRALIAHYLGLFDRACVVTPAQRDERRSGRRRNVIIAKSPGREFAWPLGHTHEDSHLLPK